MLLDGTWTQKLMGTEEVDGVELSGTLIRTGGRAEGPSEVSIGSAAAEVDVAVAEGRDFPVARLRAGRFCTL